MPIVSVTRLHLRSLWSLIPFLAANELPYAYWTVTLWTDRDAMMKFRNTGAHLEVMPKLLGWCDEASFAHGEQPESELPTFDGAYQRLRTTGRVSKVSRPSPAHAAGRLVGPRQPIRGQRLRPIASH
jgi:hypothetical protein